MAITKNKASAAERRAVAARAAPKNDTKKNAGREKAALVDLNFLNVDPFSLSDEDLMKCLNTLGANVGPINDSTRSLYIRRLGKLMKEQGVVRSQNRVDKSKEETEDKKAGKGQKKGETKEKVQQKSKGRPAQRIPEQSEIVEKEEPKKKRGGRARNKSVDNDEDGETDTLVHVNEHKEKRTDDRREERKAKDKKVSFARTAGGRKWSDEEEEEETPPQMTMRIREPSIQIVEVTRNVGKKMRERGTIEPRPNRRANRTTIVIEEDSEEEEETEDMTLQDTVMDTVNGVSDCEDEDTLLSHVLIRRSSGRIEARDDERNYEEEDEDSQEEDANTRVDRGEEEIDGIESDVEDEERGPSGEESGKEEENNRPIIRAVLTVDTPVERRYRSGVSEGEETVEEEEDEEEEDHYDDQMKTLDIFNRIPRNSIRSTMGIMRGRTYHDDTKKDEWTIDEHRNMPQIVEESEDMDISCTPRETTNQKERPRRLADLSRKLFLDDPVDMDISNESQDSTVTTRYQSDTIPLTRFSPLIVDTPKTGRHKSVENGTRNRRKLMESRREGETSHGHTLSLNSRLEESGDETVDLPPVAPPSPFEDSFTRFLDAPVEMDTLAEGMDILGANPMNATCASEARGGRVLGKTFVVDGKKKRTRDDPCMMEEEAVSGATFIVPQRRQEKKRETTRGTRNVVRSPSRSPVRDRFPTFMMPPSKSRINAAKKPSTPTRVPPKPMPRRIGTQLDSVTPPKPVPRRLPPPPPNALHETRKSRLDTKGEKRGVVSPASLFHTQPRLREEERPMGMMEKETKEFTESDWRDIEKLHSLREEIRERKSSGQPSRELDLQRREIVERCPYLRPFFYDRNV